VPFPLVDESLNVVDAVWHERLESADGAICHGGDEQEGDEIGDDEKIHIKLWHVDPRIHYISILVDSYTGHELDDVDRASCHLYDTTTGEDLATYVLTNASSLDGYTALLGACLYRGNESDDWWLHIIFNPLQARPIKYHIKDIQQYLKLNKLKAPVQQKEEFGAIRMPQRVSIMQSTRSFDSTKSRNLVD
jgi:stress response protein SCP2